MDDLIGKIGLLTASIKNDCPGTVTLAVRGGAEGFFATAASELERGTRVVVKEYFPPRTVVVAPTEET